MVPKSEQAALVASCTKTLELSDRNACDVELLCIGWVLLCVGFGGVPRALNSRGRLMMVRGRGLCMHTRCTHTAAAC